MDTDIWVERRTSNDNIVDSRGKEIIDLCISNQLRILNGRSFGDSAGKFTCYNYAGCSVVDYFIVSEKLLNSILYMNVSDFLPTLSDCHSQLSVKMLSSFEREPIMEHMNKFPNGYMWNDSSAESFLKSFSHPEIQNQLKSFMDEKIELDNQSINKATETLHNIILNVADLSLKRKLDKKKNVQNKKWFETDLKLKRKALLNKAALMSKYPLDPIIRGSFYKINKEYAKLRKFKKKQFKQNILDKLIHLQSTNPKEYWKLVNTLK